MSYNVCSISHGGLQITDNGKHKADDQIVNPEFFRRGYLKKQSQFAGGNNECKVNYNKGIREI